MFRAFFALALLLAPLSVEAHDIKHKGLMIDHPHAFALPPSVPNGAVYVEIHNMTEEADRLVAVKGDAAKMLQLHTTIKKDGVAKMRQIKDGIAVPAGGTVTLKQGGMHIMLLGIQELLVEGTSFPLTLVFEKAGDLEVSVAVEARSGGHSGDDHSNHGDHSGHEKHKTE